MTISKPTFPVPWSVMNLTDICIEVFPNLLLSNVGGMYMKN